MKYVSKIVLFILLLSGFITSQGFAHSRSQSFSSWKEQGKNVSMIFTIKAREATRLEPLAGERNLADRLSGHIASRFWLRRGGKVCTPHGSPKGLFAAEGFLRVGQDFTCSETGDLSVTVNAFFDTISSHVHFARIISPNGSSQEYLFNQHQREQEISLTEQAPQSRTSLAGSFINLGFQHILEGVDHIVFLIVLLLITRKLKDVLWLVTGFTFGHSITLALATSGWVYPDSGIIEALIGFTIAITAAETFGSRKSLSTVMSYGATAFMIIIALVSTALGKGIPLGSAAGLAIFAFFWLRLGQSQETVLRNRPVITIFFGLIHGFGFASALTELRGSGTNLFAMLLGFNMGVELGQVLIVAVIWGAFRIMAKWVSPAFSHNSVDFSAVSLGGLGVYWFIERSFSL